MGRDRGGSHGYSTKLLKCVEYSASLTAPKGRVDFVHRYVEVASVRKREVGPGGPMFRPLQAHPEGPASRARPAPSPAALDQPRTAPPPPESKVKRRSAPTFVLPRCQVISYMLA